MKNGERKDKGREGRGKVKKGASSLSEEERKKMIEQIKNLSQEGIRGILQILTP